MRRSMQEIVELVVFGLIALLLGTGVLWLTGWLLGGFGTVLIWIAGLIWALLRFIVPVAIVAVVVYFVVRMVQQGSAERTAATDRVPQAEATPTGTAAEPTHPGAAPPTAPPPAGTPATVTPPEPTTGAAQPSSGATVSPEQDRTARGGAVPFGAGDSDVREPALGETSGPGDPAATEDRTGAAERARDVRPDDVRPDAQRPDDEHRG